MDLTPTLGQKGRVMAEKHVPAVPAWAWGAFVCLVVLVVFLPALRFPFFPFWDDDIHVHANPHLAALSWESLRTFWSGPYQQLYIPLTYSTWAGLAALSRWWDGQPVATGALNAAWFHGANVLVHALSTVLLFALLRRTTAKLAPAADRLRLDMAAALGAALFALHPLQVEPVAWISGLRDVLGGGLGLASLLVLLGGEKPKFSRWLGATVLFVASLAAKPAGVALPFVAGLLGAFVFQWKVARLAREIGPWLLVGALWVVVTSKAQWAAELARDLVPVWMRPLVAADALAFYLAKVVWPAGLAADYGRAPDAAREAGWLWWTWTGPAALAAALFFVKRLRVYLLPLGVFAVALLPTLGLVPFNFQMVSTVADRYVYFALLGPALALSLVVARSARAWVAVLAALFVTALAGVTVMRLPLWSEDVKLFASTLEANPHSWKAMHNYGSALDDRGQTVEGVALMRRVVAQRPESSEAHNDLGVMLWKIGNRAEATGAIRRALDLRPTAGAAKNLSVMEGQLGNRAGSIAALRMVLAMEPADRDSLQQLAWALATAPDPGLRNGEEALALALRAVNTAPVNADSLASLVAAQAETGRFEAARENALVLVQKLEEANDPRTDAVREQILSPVEAGLPIRSTSP
jgi:tetratricopeptide (TPR) repeat protein